ncbi:MAG: DNA methyltransferase, partial [Verrucomicrobiales bacterium]
GTGAVVEIWDGHSTKTHPVTGKEVPDESARIVVYDYVNPKCAEWPEADYIVGNPPFIGASRMREALGDGYTEALRRAWKGSVPESADFVMNWWAKAAELVAKGKVKRFGFITTNSIHQTFNRRVLEPFLADAKRPLHLSYAIPDHPWVDSADGAAVRIAMTVAASGKKEGLLEKVVNEVTQEGGENEVTLLGRSGVIAANLQVGADLLSIEKLQSNIGVAVKGFELGSQGFLINDETAKGLLASNPRLGLVLHPYQNGKDLTLGKCDRYVIDFHGLSHEQASGFPELYNHILVNVEPERTSNREARTASKWWLFRRSGQELRNATAGLQRFIATTRTAKFRIFQFLDSAVHAESKIVVIASPDPFHLSVLSSTPHTIFSTRAGGWLGVGNDPAYNHNDCFET